MNIIIRFIAVWWLRSGRYRWSKLYRLLFEHRYLKESLPEAVSIEDVEACLKQVTWKLEGLLHLYDSISYPQTTWMRKKDDCGGFACLAAELLYRLNSNHRPVLITTVVKPISKSHTVCAFNNLRGNLWYFDNARLKSEQYRNYDEIAIKVSQRGKNLICWDVRNPYTFELIEFHD